MQNKYRPSRKKAVQSTAHSNKPIIILTSVLAVVVIALFIILIIPKSDKSPSNDKPDIPKPLCSDKTVYTEDIYSYMVLDDGSVMITDCDIDSTVTSLVLPDTLGGKNVTAIGDFAFTLMTRLRTLTIPEGVTYIGESAFSACGFEIVNLPSSILYIDKDAFSICDIKIANYPESFETWKKVTVGSGNSSLTLNMTFN